jgi:hypothetical protein
VLEDLLLRMRHQQGSSGEFWLFRAPGLNNRLGPGSEGVKSAGAKQSNAPGRRWAGRKISPADTPFVSFLRFRPSPSLTCQIGRVRRRNGHVRSYLTVPVSPS